ncbi:MAG: S1C family serine protease [Planctomycetaceae bacterium]
MRSAFSSRNERAPKPTALPSDAAGGVGWRRRTAQAQTSIDPTIWVGRTTCGSSRLLLMVLAGLLCGRSTGRAQSTSEAIDTVLPRVVKIFGAGGLKNLETYGTGFLVSPEGHIVTAWSHLLDTGTDHVAVVLNDGRRFEAETLGFEPTLELAVLKIDAERLPHFDLADLAEAGPGTRILAFSNMFQVAVGDEPVSVVHGVIAAVGPLSARRGRYDVAYKGTVYIVDAVTNNSGAAGGVLTTRDGRLLGMIGRQLQNTESNTWMNYAIPAAELVETVQQIQTGDFSRNRDDQSFSRTQNFTAADFGIVLVPDVVQRTPAFIDAVVRDSAAESSALRPDDLIVFANGRLVPSCRSLETELGRLQPSDDLTLVVRRGGTLITVTMTAPRAIPDR